jgi:hypothetical protein
MKDFPGAWILLIGGLFLVQTWVVPAVVGGVTASEWFKGTPEEGGSSIPLSSAQTERAFASCNRHLATRESASVLSFAPGPQKSWDIGFGRYIVQASVDVGSAGSESRRRDYLCRVHFAGGDEHDAGNWSVDGIEFSQP